MGNSLVGLDVRRDFLYSPFRYQGHQTYALGNILSLISGHEVFIEPFCGGAGVFFAKPKAKVNWLNDVNAELIETYSVIRDQPREFIDFLRQIDSSIERYEYFSKEFVPGNNLEVAARWFYLNRTSCMQTMDKFWEQDRTIRFDANELSNIILSCSQKLQGVRLTCGDFETAINEAPDNAFLFIAPPYSLHHPKERTKIYRHPFERESHLRLMTSLKQNSNRIKFMLTYREDREMRNLYFWGNNTIRTLESDNTFTDDKTKKPEDQTKKEENGKEEISIVNYRI